MNLSSRCHRLAFSHQSKLRTWQRQSALRGKIPRTFHATTSSHLRDVHLYDTLSETVQSLPESEKALAWYTCGPTTYAPSHLGHARTYVCLDVMRRVIEADATKAPLFVMNITDIDDKILAAAEESETSPLELARKYENEFWEDLDSLNCLRPHVVTRVTERVESDIIPYIQGLLDKGMAYQTEDGVYFHIKAFNEQLGHMTKYGKLAPPAASEDFNFLESGENNVSPKKDKRDFVLWKNQKSEELVSWEAPWGNGRPGWHIECSAMIEAVQKQFQDTHRFLIHAGGVDLKFPHHTNEIAQSEAYTESDWINHWVHTGHLHIDGLKMSKSLKNFITIREFLGKYDLTSPLESPGDDFRLWCLGLSGSYRAPATFSEKQLSEARAIRQKIIRFLQDGETWASNASHTNTKVWTDKEKYLFKLSDEARRHGRLALQNDLQGAKFLEEIMKVVELGNTYLAADHEGPIEPMKAALYNVRDLLALVGFSEKTTGIGLNTMDSDSSLVSGDQNAIVDELMSFRSGVRKIALESGRATSPEEQMNRMLQHCDETRESMLQKGVELLDSKDAEADDWRFCLLKTVESEGTQIKEQKSPNVDMLSISLLDLFQIGNYKGLFAEFSDDGMPTRNADGSEISKRMLKKLKKKREAHIKRLQESRK